MLLMESPYKYPVYGSHSINNKLSTQRPATYLAMASKLLTTAAATLLAVFLMLAAASSAMAQPPAPVSEPCPSDLIGRITGLSTLAAARCVCDALFTSGVADLTIERATSEVQVIFNEFGLPPVPEGFTCSLPGIPA